MLLVMFSLAGLPPTIGFYAKFMVIEAAVNDGFVWLAVVAVMASLIGAFYYLRIVKLMYFDDPVETRRIVVRGDTWCAVGERAAAADARRATPAIDRSVRDRAHAIELPVIAAVIASRAGKRPGRA